MKRIAPVLLWATLLVPVCLQSEVLYLKDGSVLKGRVVRLDPDTLYFETSFGSKLAVHREKVARIDLDDSKGYAPGEPLAGPPAHIAAEPGTLSVSFEKFRLTSRIVVKRGLDREACERENAIEQYLLAGGRKVYSLVDSVTDKAVRNGPETVLRNDVKPRDFDVALPPGFHKCVVAFGNSRASAYVELFDRAPLDKKLVLDPVHIEPGATTHVRVGVKRKWTGKAQLFKIE